MEQFRLEPHEKVLVKLHKHWILLVRDTIGTALAGLVPFLFFAFAVLAGILPESIPTQVVWFATALWLLLIWIALVTTWTQFYLDVWLVTDRHIFGIDQVSLFHRRITTWSYEHLEEVSIVAENPIQMFFGYGSLELETAGSEDTYARVEGVPHPERVRAIILRQMEHFEKLEQENKQQEELLHSISHEVKGYLAKDAAALEGITEGDFGVVPAGVKKIADGALSETRKGVDMLFGLLSTSDFKSGKMHVEKRPFDIKKAVDEIAKDVRVAAEQKGLVFNLISDDGPLMVTGDEAKMRRHVLRNLMDNAVRYTPKGGVSVRLSKSGSTVTFSVKDTGVGITPEDMKKLFTEGGKGKNSSAVNPESTGFGLFVAKNIIKAHGGKIWAESDGEGAGATFFVSLPA